VKQMIYPALDCAISTVAKVAAKAIDIAGVHRFQDGAARIMNEP